MAAMVAVPHGLFSGPLLGSSAHISGEGASADDSMSQLSGVRQKFLGGDTGGDTWCPPDDSKLTQCERKGRASPLKIRGESVPGTWGMRMRPRSASAPRLTSHTAASHASARPKTYTVRTGDTLRDIADRFNVRLEDLVKANKMDIGGGAVDAAQIRPNQVLVVPPAKGQVAGSSAQKAVAKVEQSSGADKGVDAKSEEGEDVQAIGYLYRLSSSNQGIEAHQRIVQQPSESGEPRDKQARVVGERRSRRTSSRQVSAAEQPGDVAEGRGTQRHTVTPRGITLHSRRAKSATRYRPVRTDWSSNTREVTWITHLAPPSPGRMKCQVGVTQEVQGDIADVVSQDKMHRQMLMASLSFDQFPHPSSPRESGNEYAARGLEFFTIPVYCAFLAFTMVLQASAVFGDRHQHLLPLHARAKYRLGALLNLCALGFHKNHVPAHLPLSPFKSSTQSPSPQKEKARELLPAKGLPPLKAQKDKSKQTTGPVLASTRTEFLRAQQGREKVIVKTFDRNGIFAVRVISSAHLRGRQASPGKRGSVLKYDSPQRSQLGFLEMLSQQQQRRRSKVQSPRSKVHQRTKEALEAASKWKSPGTPVAQQEVPGTAVRQQEVPPGTAVRQQEAPVTPVRQPEAPTTAVRQQEVLPTAVRQQEALATPVRQQEPLGTPVRQQEVLGTPVRQQEPPRQTPTAELAKRSVNTSIEPRLGAKWGDMSLGEYGWGEVRERLAEPLPGRQTQVVSGEKLVDIRSLNILYRTQNVESVIDGDLTGSSQSVRTAVHDAGGAVTSGGGVSNGNAITENVRREIGEPLEHLEDGEDDVWEGAEDALEAGRVVKDGQMSNKEMEKSGSFDRPSVEWNAKTVWRSAPTRDRRQVAQTTWRSVPTMSLPNGVQLEGAGQKSYFGQKASGPDAAAEGARPRNYVSAWKARIDRTRVPSQEELARGSPSPVPTDNLSQK